MSHSIDAVFAGGAGFSLSDGTSGNTLRACARTGFDLYAEYGAAHLNNGFSGAGEAVTIDAETATRAFVACVAWAPVVERYWSEHLAAKAAETGGRELVSPVIGVPIWYALGGSVSDAIDGQEPWLSEEVAAEVAPRQAEIAEREREVVSELAGWDPDTEPDEEEWTRARWALPMMVRFTHAVLLGAAEGPVSIHFA